MTREERRIQTRQFMALAAAAALVVPYGAAVLAAPEEPAEAVQVQIVRAARSGEPVGRIPGDDKPATEPCYMTEAEITADEDANPAPVSLGTVTVTHYCICKRCCGKDPSHPAYGITASGREAVPGLSVGVDPDVIPYGSEVLVDYGDGAIHRYRADDTGGGIRANHIDLCVGSHDEALALGVRKAEAWYIPGDVKRD